jgi:hypothetical protein
MPNKPMKNSIAAAAANNTHTHPLKGGGVVFAACSTREEQGQKSKSLGPRDSRNKADQLTDSGCDSITPTPIARAQRPLSHVESPAEGLHTRKVDYVSQYNAWIASMSEAERAQAAALGVDKPMTDDYRSHGIGLEADLAESKELCYSPDIAALIDGEPSATAADDLDALSEKLWDVMRHLVGELLDTPNRSLTAECLAAVSGMSYTGDSITEIAKRHRLTRAAVSKRCVELTQKLKLLPSRTMRSLTARQAYRHAQRKLRHHDET